MDKQFLIDRVLSLPNDIKAAEAEVLDAYSTVQAAKSALQLKEDGLLLGMFDDMVIDGKNETIRSAQLRQYTDGERDAVLEAEMNLTRAKYRLSQLQNEFRALQTVANLIQEVA